MSADRLYYNSAAIFASPSPATGTNSPLVQIERAKSYNYNVQVNRQDVNILGKLARLSSEIVEQPNVSFNFEVDDINANNLDALGFVVDGSVSFASGIINGTTDDRNMFVLWAPEGEDAVNNASADAEFAVQGFGNCFLNSFRAQGAVGGVPTNSFAFEALNYRVYLNRSGQASPAVNPQDGSPIVGNTFTVPTVVTGMGAAALRPGDITVTIETPGQTGIGLKLSDARIQSYDISVSMAREGLKALGTRFDVKKKIKFPAEITCGITLEPSTFTTGSLSTLLCNDNEYEVNVTLKKPSCPGQSAEVAKIYTLKGMKYKSEDGGISLSQNGSLNLSFDTQLSDASDLSIGLFISGILET